MNVDPLLLVAWLFVIFVTGVVPWDVLRNRRSVAALARVPMAERFLVMLIPQLVLGGLAIGVALFEGIDLFPQQAPSTESWLAGALFLIVALTLVRTQWRQSVEGHDQTWRLFAPADRREKKMWVTLSLAAGVAEELVWRGTLPSLLIILVGNLEAAIAISVAAFAIAHAIQGLRSVLAIATIALSFHILVLISGSLYVAMTAHFIYDVVAGFTYAALARRRGLMG